jgi:hypothetical protein
MNSIPENLEDQDPIAFTADQQEAVKKSVRKIQEHLAMINWHLDHEGISQGVAQLVMGVIEHDLAGLGKQLGVSTQANDRLEDRHAEIRKANLRIHELENLLGSERSPETIQPALKVLTKRLNDWWSLEGFGHISDMSFGEYSLKVDFSCQFFGCKPNIGSTEGMTHKERKKLWYEQLEARGFELMEGDGEKGLRDCPATREALRLLFAQRFSRHTIFEFRSRETKKGSKLVSVNVYIYDLAPIVQLPFPPEDAEEI